MRRALETPTELVVELSLDDQTSEQWIDPQLITLWAKNALNDHLSAGEVDVRICGEKEMASTNHKFAGKHYATNVLSFPADLEDDAPVNLLGDVLICAPVVDREALEQGKTRHQHLAHLLTHGVLHLLGFDHELDSEAQQMESEERRLLHRLGFPDPYADPTA